MAISAPALAAPPNDECANAIPITLGDTPFTTVSATTTGPAVCALFGRDVWFTFTSSFTGSLIVSTCGEADFDTVIAMYSGCGCGSFTSIGCNDDAIGCAGGTSRLTVAVTAGACYRIRVGGFGGATGVGTLTLSVGTPESAALADRILSGAEPGDRFGFAVAGDARFNNDSQRDVLIGADGSDHLGLNRGRAFAMRGSNFATLYSPSGAANSDNFGFAVACDCDVNGDGRSDLVIGAPHNDDNGVDAGRVYVYSGFNGALLWSRTAGAAGDQLGFSVACAGDVNNDGYQDVIVGAPYNDAAGIDAGRAHVFSGLDGATLKTKTGAAAGDLFGYAVAGIGDLNNDGRPDYAVGAPKHDAAGNNAGRVSIYSGMTGLAIMHINGSAAGDKFGWALAGRRFTDNSQQYSMLVVGAPYSDAGGTDAGRVRVYLRNHTFAGANPCTSPLCLRYTMNGGNAGDLLGWSVATGNVTGSGFADIIAGAPKADFTGSNAGAAYLFDGANGTLARRFFGEGAGDQFARSVAFAGDVNGDGKNDLVFGAPYNDAAGSNAGRTYLFFMGVSPAMALAAPEGEARDRVPGDVTGDGLANADDLAAVLARWGLCNLCDEDLNGDGAVDFDDLLAVLAAWSNGS